MISSKGEIQLSQQTLGLIPFYRSNPVLAAEDLLNVSIPVVQQVLLEGMWYNKFVIITAGRGTGKTWLLAAFACLKGMLYPGTKVGLVAPSFRQCVVGSTYVFTSGMVQVGDLLSSPSVLVSDIGPKPCSGFYKNLPEKTVKLSMSSGISVEGALDHRVLCFSEAGPVYRKLNSIGAGEFVCLQRGSLAFSTREVDVGSFKPEFFSKGNLRREYFPDTLTKDLAYFIGLLTGDGNVNTDNYIQLSNTDTDIIGKFSELCQCFFGRPPSIAINKATKVSQCVIGSKLGFEFLRSLGVAGKKAHQKVIPSAILKSPARVQAAFVRGLFDTDGCVYFNKHVSHSYKLNIGFVSEQLSRVLQLVLLNFGILANLSVRETEGRRPMFVLEASDKKSMLVFKEFIGFDCSRKQRKLDEACEHILASDVSRSNKDFIPFAGELIVPVVRAIRSAVGTSSYEYLHLYRYYDKNCRFIGGLESITTRFLKGVIDYCDNNTLQLPALDIVRSVLDRNLIPGRVVDISFGFDYTYDFTVDDVHNYISNGVVSHNSKNVFEEVKKMYLASPVFREATAKRPTFQSDRCVLEFRASGGRPPSMIEAVPLGTGEKIRGARFHVILADEFAQLPEEIFDAVIKPMAATSSDPMERVKQLERVNELRALGVSEAELVDQLSSNSIIMTSSAFFKFNHMYKRIQEYNSLIKAGKKGYAVLHANFLDMPPGFMNEDIIQEAQATMASSLFRMEYLGIWESDSDGVFKASLIRSRTLAPGDSVRFSANPDYKYVISCDPARTTDFFSIVVFEIQPSMTKVVYAEQHQNIKFPKMADRLMQLVDDFKACRLVMDSQGGGHAVKDILADETKYSSRIIIDMNDEEYFGIDGNHILELVNPSPSVNAECVWSSLKLLESSQLFFSGPPTSGSETDEIVYETVEILINQLLNIVVTSTKSGSSHFDVPSGGGHGVQKKDLFSAFIYGAKKIADMSRESDTTNILWDVGVVSDRSSKSRVEGSPKFLSSSSAVLEGRVK